MIGGAVLHRELVREARKPATWALRVLFAGGVLAMVITSAADTMVYHDNPASLAQFSRGLLVAVWAGALLLSAFAAPIAGAAAITEECQDGTLELLSLTPLTAAQVLWGKIASRLISVWMVFLASLPVLAIISSFGAIAPSDVARIALNGLLLLALGAAFSATLALRIRSVPMAALATLGWAFAAMVLLPEFARETLRHSWVSEVLLTPLRLARADERSSLLTPLLYLPAFWALMRFAVPRFRLLTAGDDAQEDEVVSAEIWEIERDQRRTAGLVLALGAGWVALRLTWHEVRLLPYTEWVVIAWFAAAQYALAAVTLLLLERLAALGGDAHTDNELRGGFTIASRWRRWWRPGTVWSTPLLWREVATRAHGPVGRISLALGAATFVGFAFTNLFGWNHADATFLASTPAGLAMLPLLGAVAAGGVLHERAADRGALLTLAGVGRLRLVGAKVVAALVLSAPVWWAPWALYLRMQSTRLSWNLPPRYDPYTGYRLAGEPVAFPWITAMLWVGLLALTLASAAAVAADRLPNTRATTTVAPLAPAILFTLPWFFGEVLDDLPGTKALYEVAYPWHTYASRGGQNGLDLLGWSFALWGGQLLLLWAGWALLSARRRAR